MEVKSKHLLYRRNQWWKVTRGGGSERQLIFTAVNILFIGSLLGCECGCGRKFGISDCKDKQL